MTEQKRFQQIKQASIAAVIVTAATIGFLTYLDYERQRNTFENLDQVKRIIEEYHEVDNDPLTITKSEMNEQTNQMNVNDIPLDEIEAMHDSKLHSHFRDRNFVIKYFVSLAMQGLQDEFFEQFDPNIYASDFPDVKSLSEDQDNAFRTFTRDSTLENIRILSSSTDISMNVIVEVELIYSDQKRATIPIQLIKMGHDHGTHVEWYVASSIHYLNDLIKNLDN